MANAPAGAYLSFTMIWLKLTPPLAALVGVIAMFLTTASSPVA